MSGLLIRDATILPMAGEKSELLRGDIVVRGSTIASVAGQGEAAQPGVEAGAGEGMQVIEAGGMLAMPGLVNCHQHAAMTLFRGYSDDLRLMEWLETKIWPAEARLTAEDVYWGTMLAIAEMIRSGTTTFADMYFFMDDVARAVSETGIRASLARGLLFMDRHGEERLRQARTLYEGWHGAADGRVTVMLGPHSPYTCPPEGMRKVLALAAELRAPVHIHLAETVEEDEQCHSAYGKSPARYLADLGLFAEHQVLAAHAVHLSEDDLDLMAGMRGGISHNPVSNQKLGCGVAPVTETRARGIAVGLGTDGAGSATTLDMFEEVRAAAWLQKNRAGDPTALTAYEALRMATREGARALGLDGRIGTLEPGKAADLILVDLRRAHLTPRFDPVALLAYAAGGGDVDTTIVNGRVLMLHRRLLTIDEGEVLEQVEARARRVIYG